VKEADDAAKTVEDPEGGDEGEEDDPESVQLSLEQG
jgi:hypothetical protein